MFKDKEIIIEAFSKFLEQQKNLLSKAEYSNYILSFKLPSCEPDLSKKLDSLIVNFPKIFFMENAEQNYLIMGIGSALDIFDNGLGRFTSLSKQVSAIKHKVIFNLKDSENEFPFICGGMKFTSEHSRDEWKDFNDSDWFIPEFIFLKISGEKNLIYNFVYQNSSITAITENFSKKLNELFELEPKHDNKIPKVLSSNGLSPKDKKKWKLTAQSVIDKLSEQNISKVVLSRRVALTLSEQLNWNLMRNYFAENYPDSSIYFYHKNNSTFFGASPERLIKFHKRKLTVDIIAGSAVRGENSLEDKYLEEQMNSSKKLIAEHDFVLHQVKKSLSKYVSKILTDRMPFKKLKEIQHIHTLLQTEMLPEAKMFEIIDSLFPTAAVCGEPKEKALNLIKKFEDYDRGLYTGFIGWFNLKDEGEFIVGIRSALLNNKKLFAYAGVGILAESDPELEFQETELKLKTILNYFNAANK